MNKNFKQFLALIMGLLIILPAFAETTVSLETSTGITLLASESLDFGTVDAMGVNDGNYPVSSSSGMVSGNIQMLFLDTSNQTHQTQQNIENSNGTIYYLEDALVLRVSSSLMSNMNINVENIGSFTVLVTQDASSWSTSGTNISGSMIRTLESKSFQTNVPSGATLSVDVGIHIPFSIEGGSKSSTITFTASEI